MGGSGSFGSSGFSAIVAEFTACWERGEPVRVETFLERMPFAHPADVVELIYREFCLAESLGLDPKPSEFVRRFPDREESLERLFQLHGALSSGQLQEFVSPRVLPGVGDEIGPYTLLRELGRGSFARVFLAEQADLEDRLVVVKISTKLTPEPRLLARARHAHIVEVFWHGTAEDGALQLIAMPFLGGASLSAVLAERRRLGRRPRGGSDLLADLDRVSAAEYPRANLSRPAREILERLTYPAALAWIVARLAEGLDHAFSRGVAHGDIKPSNVLLAADGTPMLLDFNLAVSWRLTGGTDLAADPGGTLAYMAPERLRAVASPERLSTPRAGERHRADIFALGVVLLESLTCREPDLPQTQARTRQEIAEMLARTKKPGGEAARWLARSRVPSGLRSILSRCLAADPADRYQRASELAEDLDRWRTDRPLTFAGEPPRHSRLARWARRRRTALLAMALALFVGGLVLAAGWLWLQASLRSAAQDRLAQIWDRDPTIAFAYRRSGHWEAEEQGRPIENARRRLAQFDVEQNADWRNRADIHALPEPERSELVLWLLEQILRYTRALSERGDSRADWQRAVALLDRELSRTAFGPFETQRRILLLRLKRPEGEAQGEPRADAQAPARWMEQYLLGIEAEPHRVGDALVHFNNALRDRPGSFWSHYRASAAAFRLTEFQLASEHLAQCSQVRPKNAALHTQRAGCLYELNDLQAALEECHKAIQIDPENEEATRTLTYIRSELGQTHSAVEDFRRFTLISDNERETTDLGLRLNVLAPRGIRDLLDSLGFPDDTQIPPGEWDVEARIVRAAKLRKLCRYEEALVELDRAVEIDSEHLPARYYRASLLSKLGRDEADADYLFLVQHPRLEELLAQYDNAIGIFFQCSKAHLYAGRINQAVEMGEKGVVQANRAARLRPEAYYTLARAHTALARTQPEVIPRIVEELRIVQTLNPNYLDGTFEKDRFFDELRPRIRPLLLPRR